MASVQVLKKQEHLEAGKKKLEEFRRKRAAKKATPTNAIIEKKPSDIANVSFTDCNGVGTSDALAEGRPETSTEVPKKAEKEYETSNTSDYNSSSNKHVGYSLSDRNNDIKASVLGNSYPNNEGYINEAAKDKFQIRNDEYGASVEIPSGVGKSYPFSRAVLSAEENHPSSSFTSDMLDKYPSNDTHHPEKDVWPANATTSSTFAVDIMPKDFVSSRGTTSSYPESHDSSSNINDSAFGSKKKFSLFSDMGEKKISSAFNHSESTNHSSSWTSDDKVFYYNSEARSSLNLGPPSPPASGRRSRPSFLDSIQLSKGPSSSPPLFCTEKDDISSSKVFPVDGLGSSDSQRLTNISVESGNGVGLFNHMPEDEHNFFPQKQNEDFSALEQHIEDLTQEKFSLQRALEASRSLAESLASENSALTDSFNQQGSVVNQLKTDLESLQEEIKAQMVELNAVKMEYANAQLECDAADERSKLLASEVIALEEKALRLRSNELKLERELENTEAEISSYRKRMSSLEKDCQDLQSTIDALQEEKSMLQSKLRKASSSGKLVDFNKTSITKTDVSTSTEDLDTNKTMESENMGTSGTVLLGDEVPSSQFSPENGHLNLEGLTVGFPSDQIRMIQNINTLIAELALEKDQLMQALSAESSQSFKLSELNKELTRKLEAQTQRLELLMAQSMANDNNQSRHPDIRTVHEITPYADEGDEVVERVLGWIMKLFPGGPSGRRPSKHL